MLKNTLSRRRLIAGGGAIGLICAGLVGFSSLRGNDTNNTPGKATPTPREIDVSKESADLIRIRAGANEENQLSADLPPTEIGQKTGFLFERISISHDSEAPIEISVHHTNRQPVEIPKIGVPDAIPLAYALVSHPNLPDREIREVAMDFSIRKERIRDGDTSRTSASLFRFVDGVWQQLETGPIEDSESHIRFRARSTGLSPILGAIHSPINQRDITAPQFLEFDAEWNENRTVSVETKVEDTESGVSSVNLRRLVNSETPVQETPMTPTGDGYYRALVPQSGQFDYGDDVYVSMVAKDNEGNDNWLGGYTFNSPVILDSFPYEESHQILDPQVTHDGIELSIDRDELSADEVELRIHLEDGDLPSEMYGADSSLNLLYPTETVEIVEDPELQIEEGDIALLTVLNFVTSVASASQGGANAVKEGIKTFLEASITSFEPDLVSMALPFDMTFTEHPEYGGSVPAYPEDPDDMNLLQYDFEASPQLFAYLPDLGLFKFSSATLTVRLKNLSSTQSRISVIPDIYADTIKTANARDSDPDNYDYGDFAYEGPPYNYRRQLDVLLPPSQSRTADFTQIEKLVGDGSGGIDDFGRAVALGHDRAVVGAPDEDNSNGSEAGSVYVFDRSTDGTWSLETKLIAGNGDDDDRFGQSVALDGDTILVGAPGTEHSQGFDAGTAYFWRHTGGNWRQEATLRPGAIDVGDTFGQSVSLAGDLALVGAPIDEDPNGPDAGSAYLFARSVNSWSQEAKLVPDDGDTDDQFGQSVSLDGDRALIGAPNDEDPNGSNAGSVYVFELAEDTWQQREKIVPDDGDSGDWFGGSAVLDGDRALIGAPNDEDPNGPNAGAAYLFVRDSETWTQRAKLAPDDGDTNDFFGTVSLDGSRAVIGAPGDEDPNGSLSGSAYGFDASNGSWNQRSKLAADDGNERDLFGRSVSLAGDLILIGAPPGGRHTRQGAAYVFEDSQG